MSNKRKCEDDNVSLESLKNNSYIPHLTQEDVEKIMTYVQQDRRDGLAEKLLNLKIDYEFENEFGGNVSDRELSRLSIMYRNDIEKIKDHILYTQADALVTYIKKGYIDVEDM
jgi:hypothetical protein